ncbi:MAG: CBS domain-containing protein [archaeon]
MQTGLKVGDAMTKSPIIVRADSTLVECAKIMASNHVGALVVQANGKPEGVLTEQDIVRGAIATGKDPASTEAGAIVEKKLLTISPDEDIYDALVVMRDANIRHLPVVNEDKMIGLLTLKDILKIQPQLFDLLVEKFEIREESDKPIFYRDRHSEPEE